MEFGGGRVCGGHSGLGRACRPRLAAPGDRARWPSSSSFALGSRAPGGHVEDASDSAAEMHFLNGVPEAGWMDGSYTFSPLRGRTPRLSVGYFCRVRTQPLEGKRTQLD